MQNNHSRRTLLQGAAAAILLGAGCTGGSEDAAAATTTTSPTTSPSPAPSTTFLAGVNVAGLEFNPSTLPGTLNRNYVAPEAAEIAYYHARGAKVLRIPFRWERAQPTLGGDLNSAYIRLLDAAISQAQSLGMSVVLDAHQYGRRRINGQGYIIGESSQVTSSHFSNFWRRMASRYKSRPVIYNLTNEPHDQDKAVLVNVQNSAISAIRATGSSQLILVSGSNWSGAHSWVSSGNAEAMMRIRDPANNFAFDVHQYLDSNSSGTSSTCVTGSARRLRAFTEWARTNRKRGFLGEFGGAANSACGTEIRDMVTYMKNNRDVWIGWTWWGGGAWWAESYPFKLRPVSLSNPVDRPQMAWLDGFRA